MTLVAELSDFSHEIYRPLRCLCDLVAYKWQFLIIVAEHMFWVFVGDRAIQEWGPTQSSSLYGA